MSERTIETVEAQRHRHFLELHAERQTALLEQIAAVLAWDVHPYRANRAPMDSDKQRCIVCGAPDGPPNHPAELFAAGD